MKPSEILQIALDNFYGKSNEKRNDLYMDEYMCHAISRVNCSLAESRACKDTFMSIIARQNTGCLTIYLKQINYEGKYLNLVDRYGHCTESTYKLRVKWWKSHIEQLKAKGM